MNVLAIGAHPDDIELQCAGSLAMYAKDPGNRVYMAVVTNGDKGNFDIDPIRLAEIRKQETQASAEVIGAELIWMGYPDEYLENTLENRMIFVDLIRNVDPDLIITHGANDYHPDHRYTHQLVSDAVMLAGVHQVKTALTAITKQVALFFMDNTGGIDFQPTELVDITDSFEIKKRALGMHESQIRIFKQLLNVDLIDMIETVGKFRGYQAGCKYAEGFTKVEGWYRGSKQRLLPVGTSESLFNYKITPTEGEEGKYYENHGC